MVNVLLKHLLLVSRLQAHHNAWQAHFGEILVLLRGNVGTKTTNVLVKTMRTTRTELPALVSASVKSVTLDSPRNPRPGTKCCYAQKKKPSLQNKSCFQSWHSDLSQKYIFGFPDASTSLTMAEMVSPSSSPSSARVLPLRRTLPLGVTSAPPRKQAQPGYIICCKSSLRINELINSYSGLRSSKASWAFSLLHNLLSTIET